jgi:hypothetical protein
MSPGAQNKKTGLDALGTNENESESAKHEYGTRHTRHPENDFGGAKHENDARRLRYRRKRFRERKT